MQIGRIHDSTESMQLSPKRLNCVLFPHDFLIWHETCIISAMKELRKSPVATLPGCQTDWININRARFLFRRVAGNRL